MDSKIEDALRVNISNDIGSTSKTKGKDKARKELWDSLLAVYENEKDKGIKCRLQQEVPNHCTDLTSLTKHGVKLKKKSKHTKKTLVNENGDAEHNITQEKDKGRHKFKDLKRHKKILNTIVGEGSFKDQEKSVPSVIVLHKYKKDRFNVQTEPYAEEISPSGKPNHKPEKNRKKTKVEHKFDSPEHILVKTKGSCNNIKSSSKIEDGVKPSPSNKDLFKNKIRKKQDKGVCYKTLSTSLEPKLRKKRKKLDRQQVLKEVVTKLNINKDVYEEIKRLPIKIDENQLIFMHPSHIAKALEHIKDKNINKREKVNSDSTCDELNASISHNITKKKECSKTSSTKLALDNRASSKRLRVLTSLKKVRRSIPLVVEEKSDISFIKVLKNKKDPRKKRSKLSSEKKRSIQELLNTIKEPKRSQKLKFGNNLIQSENSLKQNSSILRQNVCFGDNQGYEFGDDSVGKCDGQNGNVSTTLSGSSRYKPKCNTLDFDLRNDSAIQKSKNFLDIEQKLRKNSRKEVKGSRKVIQSNDDNKADQIKPVINEDEKKLTFQLIKTGANCENHRRLRKNLYSVSDRRMLMANKEKISPTLQNDRLYVTKRMLFYTNKESSSTSKESLNIAIRRDTEISNNGSSNNILNVVIKQKKNSVSSAKSANSPKLDIESQCNNNSLEKISKDNYSGTICKNELECMNKNKQLKEAECQTDVNTLIKTVDKGNEGNGNKVPPQSFQLGSSNIEDEFHNFLLYHFQNINPSFRKNNPVSNSHGDEENHDVLDKNQKFQPCIEKSDDHNKCCDTYSNTFTRNINVLTPENLTCKIRLSGNVQNLDTKSCTKNNCIPTKKQFYRVVSSDDHDSQKSNNIDIYGVTKSNTTDDNKCKSVVTREITKPNLRIIEDLCHKTESENIAEKLKSIGLSDKKSFVKVLNSNYSHKISINTKIDSHNESLPFKSSKNPQKQKDCITRRVAKDDLRTVINESQQNQELRISTNDKLSPTKKSQTGKVINSLPKLQMTKTKENYLLGTNSINTADIHKSNPTNPLENTIINNFQIATEDYLKPHKQNFFSILSANEDTNKSNDIITKPIEQTHNKFEVLKKTSCCMKRNFIVSEVGVQTETYDFLPTVPPKNVFGLKMSENSNFDSTKKNNIKETVIFVEKQQPSNKNMFGLVLNDRMGISLQEKGSFVHVINKKSDNDVHLNTNETLMENKPQVGFPVNFSEHKGEKKISILKSYREEKKVIEKINAVYEFLQYLDKMLKENSFLKLNRNINDTHTIGHFNNTLRCLCDNCMEIINKIEVKESINRNKILELKKSLENLASKNVNSNFRRIIYEPKNGNNSLNTQYVTQNKFKNNRFIANDIKLNSNHMNPFFLVSPEEKPYKKIGNGCLKDEKINQCTQIQKNKHGSDRNKTNFYFKDTLPKQEIEVNKCSFVVKEELFRNKTINSVKNTPKKNTIHNTIAVDRNKAFDEQILQRLCSQDNSGKFLQVSESFEKTFKNESIVNNEQGDNFSSKCNFRDISKMIFNPVKYISSKSKLDPYECRNSNGLSKQDHKSIANFCSKPSNILLHPMKNNGLKPKLTLSSYKNDNFYCLDAKNTYDADISHEETKHLQNNKNISCLSYKNNLIPRIQNTAGDEFKFCKNCNNSKHKCCCSQGITKMWIHRMKSPFTISFKKDDKTAKIGSIHQQPDLSTDNVIKTCETKPSENKMFEEPKIEEKYNPETQHRCMTHPTTELNIKQNSNSRSFVRENKVYNCKICKRESKIKLNQQYLKGNQSDNVPLDGTRHQSNMKNFKGCDANVPGKQKMNTSNSVEYLNATDKYNDDHRRNLEDRDMDSDGWVPLTSSEITKNDNNQIYFDMDINDMTVRHVEYVQRFPKNLSHRAGEK